MRGFDDVNVNVNVGSTYQSKSCAGVQKSHSGVYKFDPEPPHILRSTIKNSPLSGITFPSFIAILYHKRKSIEWYRYSHRLLVLFLMSIFNSYLSLLEYVYILYLYTFRRRSVVQMANQTHLHHHPVFVLGHPRTGTTLLHSLLALDTERFAICDTFMVGFPHCFLWFERIGKFLFSGILSETRPMDNMKLHFDLPQEDELGTNLLSGLSVSPYTSLVFMKDERHYRKYQCFKEDEVNKDQTRRWVRSFRYFLWKIGLRDLLLRRRQQRNDDISAGIPRRIVLKSPCHTGRVRLLLKLFPDAKFIFIHRNPYEVFLSSAHLASTTYGWMFLQQPSDEDLQEYILKQGEILHDEYFSCRSDESLLLYKKNCVEVSFEKLTLDPVGSMRDIYHKLGFDSFDPNAKSLYPDRLKVECEQLKGYQRNNFSGVILDPELKDTIKNRWKNQFEVLGYSRDYSWGM